MFDKIIVVKADRNLLLSRIKSRDKVGEDRALSMLDAQCDQYNFTAPTISIFNNGDKNVLQQQLEKILNNG